MRAVRPVWRALTKLPGTSSVRTIRIAAGLLTSTSVRSVNPFATIGEPTDCAG